MVERLVQKNAASIGVQNANTAKKILDQLGISIKAADLGGQVAHQIVVHCPTGLVEFKKIPGSIQDVVK